MKEFWDLFRTMPRLIGGCIWDYKDQALLDMDPSGNPYYAYGGDFGEELHDGNFCINGIVAADNRPKAAMFECKRVYQPVECSLNNDPGSLVKVENRHAAKSLEDYDAELHILQDGEIISRHDLGRISLSPGNDTILDISAFLPEYSGMHEYLADIRFSLNEDTPWAKAGHIVASNQLSLTGIPMPRIRHEIFPELSLSSNDTSYTISGTSFVLGFCKATGALNSWLIQQEELDMEESERLKSEFEELVFSPLSPNFTRALTDNDRRGWKPQRKLEPWFQANPVLIDMDVNDRGNGRIEVQSVYNIIDKHAELSVIYTIRGDGVVEVDYSLKADRDLPDIPRIGMQFGVGNDLSQISYYGRGPLENYIDRRYGFDAGIYSMPVEEFIEPYVWPQENGNRTDVRWMSLSNSSGNGLLVVADSLLNMSAWPWTQQNLDEAEHTYDLRDAGYITLNIDLSQMGVGGNDTWSDVSSPLDEFRIPSGNYHYRFYIYPLEAGGKQINKITFRLKTGSPIRVRK